ncbi:hypothetical protein ACA910_009442 [Epithemia clementina (nom. ined.)]
MKVLNISAVLSALSAVFAPATAENNPRLFLGQLQQHQNNQRNLQAACPAPSPGPPPPIDSEILFLAVSIPALDAKLGGYETPMALRFTNYFGAMWWNCIAVYSDNYKDTLTQQDPAVKVLDTSLHTTANRGACIVQTIATYNSLSLPEAQEGFFSSISGNNPLSLDVTAVTGISFDDALDPEVAACGTNTGCLQTLATAQNYDPKLMGHIVAKMVYDYSIDDGFNQLGTDDGCQASCRAYRDVTGYAPKNDPYKIESKQIEELWEPLLEDNGKGFFYHQEHVTPHIGRTAKFRYLQEAERTTRVAANPNYSKKRTTEAQTVISRMSQLDDEKKIEIEIFDNKLIVANSIIDAFLGKLISSGFDDPIPEFQKPGLFVSLERFVHFISGYLAAELDSLIIAWKEKVNYDLVRPTSVIKKLGGSITTWAPGGVQTFRAQDFEAYIRVMPHSEYVSGTSCLFQAVEDYVLNYLTGIGLSSDFPVKFPSVDIGESVVEPGLVPSSCVTLEYLTVQAMNTAGSQSRLNGGMHFPASVQGGKDLCLGIGSEAAFKSFDLYHAA